MLTISIITLTILGIIAWIFQSQHAVPSNPDNESDETKAELAVWVKDLKVTGSVKIGETLFFFDSEDMEYRYNEPDYAGSVSILKHLKNTNYDEKVRILAHASA
jgi:hypothetical protein